MTLAPRLQMNLVNMTNSNNVCGLHAVLGVFVNDFYKLK
jgi:hypothetical protein